MVFESTRMKKAAYVASAIIIGPLLVLAVWLIVSAIW